MPFPDSSSEGSRNASPAPHSATLPAFDFPLRPPTSGLSSQSSSVSLGTHFVPNKFSAVISTPTSSHALLDNASPSPRRRHPHSGADQRRRSRKYDEGPEIPKMGGGVDAFRAGEARMAGADDEDSDFDQGRSPESSRWFGPTLKWRSKTSGGHRLRWNKFKWTLFAANVVLTLYTLVTLIVCILYWFDVFHRADIIRVGNRTELILSTLAATSGLFTALLGWAGIFLNNRSFLAVHNLLLWITFIFMLVPGYITYKRRTFNLEGKINAQWSRGLGAEGRLRIQNQLHCCGYFSPFIEATISQTCYARSMLPGCKLPYILFERDILKTWYTIIFSLVGPQIVIMTIALLCSNHVTYRFGKGMMPKAYRLSLGAMAVIMDNYASQLVEQYGSGVASEILARSRSNLQLDAIPQLSYMLSSRPSSGAESGSSLVIPENGTSSASGGGAAGPSSSGMRHSTQGGGGPRYETLATKPPLDSEDSLQ